MVLCNEFESILKGHDNRGILPCPWSCSQLIDNLLVRPHNTLHVTGFLSAVCTRTLTIIGNHIQPRHHFPCRLEGCLCVEVTHAGKCKNWQT
jgi:hypothetical protein